MASTVTRKPKEMEFGKGVWSIVGTLGVMIIVPNLFIHPPSFLRQDSTAESAVSRAVANPTNAAAITTIKPR